MPSRLIVYLVSFAAFLGPFTQTIYAPILPDLQSRFHTSRLVINLTISIFTFVLAAMQIVYGPLVDARGRRRVLLAGLGIYILASAACAFSGTAGALLLFRAVQAVGIAAGSVVATTVIGDLFTGDARGRAMGTFQMLVALGSVIGPVAGGFIGSRSGHTGIFLTLAAIGLLVLALDARFLPETRPEGAPPRGRIGPRHFARILAEPRGSAVVLLGFVQYYAFYCFLVFLPEVLQRDYGLTPEKTGIAFLPLSLAVVTGSFFGGRAQAGRDAVRLLLGTALLNALSILAFALLAGVSLPLLIAACTLFGLLLGLSLPVQTSLLAGAFVHDRATAIGVYNFARYLGMAAGPLAGSFLYRLGGVPLLFGFAAAAFGAAVWFGRRVLVGRAPGKKEPIPDS